MDILYICYILYICLYIYTHKKHKILLTPRTIICPLGGDIALVENTWDRESKYGQVTEALKFRQRK